MRQGTDRLVAVQPADARAHYNRAVVLQHLGRVEQAQTAYRQVLTIEPGHERARQALAALSAAQPSPAIPPNAPVTPAPAAAPPPAMASLDDVAAPAPSPALGRPACANHPGEPASTQCAGCQKWLCLKCVASTGGRPYCAECQAERPPSISTTVPVKVFCGEAGTALILSLVGLVGGFFIWRYIGLVFGGAAVRLAMQARERIACDHRLRGREVAIAALVIGVLAVIVWVWKLAIGFGLFG